MKMQKTPPEGRLNDMKSGDLVRRSGMLKDCIMLPLQLAFIGFDRKQTMEHFKEFAAVNHDEIVSYSRENKKIILRDGTVIHAITGFGDILGKRFDQVVIAVDRRGMRYWTGKQIGLFHYALDMTSGYRIPEDCIVLKYDLDSEEG